MSRLANSSLQGSRYSFLLAFFCALLLHLVLVSPVLVSLTGFTFGSQSGADNIRAALFKPSLNPRAGENKPPSPSVQPPSRYQQALVQQIHRSWRGHNAGVAADMTCVLHIRLRANGQVISVEIARSSGSQAFDESVLQAVRATSPLAPPPSTQIHNGIYEFNLLFNLTR